MSSVRLCVIPALVVSLLGLSGSPTLRGQSSNSLNGHLVRLDTAGRLLAWTPTQDDAYNQILSLSTNYLINGVPTGNNGLKLYYSYSYADPGSPVRPANWPHNPAGLFAMLTDSGLGYYAYSGDPAIMTLVRNVLTYHLDHGMTPSTWHWPSVPYASSDPGATEYRGASWGNSSGVGDGTGVIQPDKVGELGAAFLDYYRFSGSTRFRDAAIQAADALASHVRVGDASRSPWPFRVYAQTNVIREEYSAHVISPIRLFDELIRLNIGDVQAYRNARQTAWTWLMAYPMRNNVWSNYFEDVDIVGNTSNYNQLNAGETARYLMQHPEMDPDWEPHVRGIIAWIESRFGSTQFGANTIAEQMVFFHVMGSHTARYASLNALLYELTGDQNAREKAYRSFNWATYMCSPTGVVIDGPTVNHVWWTDGYGDYIKHFVSGLGSVPEWAPPGQSRLLRSTSIVRSVQYASDQITYEVSDAASREVLRLAFTPQSVISDGVALPRLDQAGQQGWTFDSTTGVLRIRHDAGTQIVVSGTATEANRPPVVNLTSPAAGTYSASALTLSANATDTDGAIQTVEFYQSDVRVGSSTAQPYTFAWNNISPGTYILTAVATDDLGAKSTSAPVQVTVSSTGAPTTLTAATNGASVTLTWAPPLDATGIASYSIHRSTIAGFAAADGNQVGQSSGSPYVDQPPSPGSYYYRVRPISDGGVAGPASNEAAATIAGSLQVARVVYSDGTGNRTTPTFALNPGDLALAFVAADGPSSGSQSATVTGGGLTWTLVRRVTAQRGLSEIWRATPGASAGSVAVTATLGIAGYDQSLTVVTFSGASGVGASATASASTGAPTVSLTTTKAGALVYGVGNDWDRAVTRVPLSGQALVHQWIDTRVGDTFWVQALAAPVSQTGTVVQLRDSSPTTNRWNFAAVEIVPATPAVPRTVPNVVGQTESEASGLILSAGLVLGTVSHESSASVASGTVISQSPPADTQAAAGTPVTILVSTGPPLLATPNLLGLPQGQAETLITSAALTLGTITSYSHATVPAGNVISQTPAAGALVALGSRVNLIVSAGPQLVGVPDLVGQTQSNAQSLVTSAGLLLGSVSSQASATVAVGVVISQVPAAATQAIAGSQVNIVISSGPATVTVPDVVGQSQAGAQALLTTAGLLLGTVKTQPSTLIQTGTVISQSPAPLSLAGTGSAVNLVISSGAPAAVPLAVSRTVFSDGTGTRTTAGFSVAAAELLLAFVSSDGPSSGAQTATVAGGGLSWTLVRRVNTQRGVSEIWRASPTSALASVAVTSTQSRGGYHQSLTVVGFTGASGVGASATASASSGAPTVTLTTTRAGSFVYGVGNDWDRAVGRVTASGQVIVHQWIDTSVGDTFWVQAASGAVPDGTVVQLRATSPTNDRWNFAAVEILAR